MDEYSILEKIGRIAGISGIAIGVFLFIFKDMIRKNIFPSLSRQQAYNIIKLVLILTFLIAVLGIGAWVWSESIKNGQGRANDTHNVDKEKYRRIYFQVFGSASGSDDINTRLTGHFGDWNDQFC